MQRIAIEAIDRAWALSEAGGIRAARVGLDGVGVAYIEELLQSL
jgi:hypothetical protein